MAEKDIKKVKNKEDKELAVKKVNKKATEKKEVTEKKATKTAKAKAETATTKKVATSKKEPVKKTTTSKSSKKEAVKTSTTTAKKTSSHKKSTKTTAKPMLAEYYDLPYRYNETTVKILAQTPTTLFVYWDISDEDRTALMNAHGENFFYVTRPILVVHNVTKNYSFEIEINDFANSWYIRTQEPNCDYVIELGRKYNNFANGDYIYINSSNDIVSPNDHILFENIDLRHVLFKNVKTSALSYRDFGDLRFINNMDKLYGNIYDVYRALYNDEFLNELSNPSSGEFIMK